MPFFNMTLPQYTRVVRLSAAYDLAVTWVFALPWTFAWVYGLLQIAATALALPGDFPPPNPAHMLMANLLGSVVIVWSLARWLQPSVQLGRLDALARGLFAVWQTYAVSQGASASCWRLLCLRLGLACCRWRGCRLTSCKNAMRRFCLLRGLVKRCLFLLKLNRYL